MDYRERRGHAFMLEVQDNTERVKQFKQPGACLHCHASIIPAYRKEGGGDVMKGFELVCAMPLKDARKLVSHPVSCIDCHDPQTMQLRVSRPGFVNGIKELARTGVIAMARGTLAPEKDAAAGAAPASHNKPGGRRKRSLDAPAAPALPPS